jgi:Mg-chelatase subunit ChlD
MVALRRACFLVALFAVLGISAAVGAPSTDSLNLPQELPDGSKLVSVKDVFTEVADPTTAEQLRANMPHVLGGTEYHYTAEEGGQVVSDWGILVFGFRDSETALADFQHVATTSALASKNPRFIRYPELEPSLALQSVLGANLADACVVGEVVVVRLESAVVWVDDYQVSYASANVQDLAEDQRYAQAVQKAVAIAESLASGLPVNGSASSMDARAVRSSGPLTASFRDEWYLPPFNSGNAVFRITNKSRQYIYLPTSAIRITGIRNVRSVDVTLETLDLPRRVIADLRPLLRELGLLDQAKTALELLYCPPLGIVDLAQQAGPFLIATATGLDTTDLFLSAIEDTLSVRERAALTLFMRCFLYCGNPSDSYRPPLWVTDGSGCVAGGRESNCRCSKLCNTNLSGWQAYADMWALPKDPRAEPAYVMPPNSELVFSLDYGRTYENLNLDCVGLDVAEYQALSSCWTCASDVDVAMVYTICGVYDDSPVEHAYDEFPYYSLQFRAKSTCCADLVPLDVAVGEATSGGEREITFSIKNVGAAAAGPSRALLQVDGKTILDQDVPALDSDETSTHYSVTWQGPRGGHTVSLQADAENALAECNEENNSLQSAFRTEALPSTPKVPASSTVLVIDVSGSMGDQDQTGKTKMEAAKAAAQGFVAMFKDENKSSGGGHRLGIVTFTKAATRALELTADASQAAAVISQLAPQKGTNLVDALSLANSMLASAEAGAKRIIVLLSDGVPNVSSSVQGDLEAFQQEVRWGPVAAAKSQGTCLHVVGLGEPGVTRSNGDPSVDETFLRTIAQDTGCGIYYSAANASDLRRVYMRARHESLGILREAVTGRISQGETTMVGTAVVPSGQDELHYTVDWPGSRLDPLLIDPQGHVVDETYPGATIATHPTMAHVIVLNPLAGEWRMGAVGTDVPEGTTEYQALLSTRGEVTFDFPTFLGSLVSLLLTMLLIALLAALGVP